MNTEILKEYNLGQINELAKNYKFVMIEDINGKKITNWNDNKTTITAHLKECCKRLKMEIVANGYYYFCFALTKNLCKDHSDKYLYCKGKPPAENPLNDHNNTDKLQIGKNDLLSVTSALNYITQIAELKTENNRLTMELKQTNEKLAVCEAEIEEYEREEETGLSAGGEKGTMEFLKDQAPTITALMDRFFTQRDKQLDIEMKRLELGEKAHTTKKRTIKKLEFEPGSEEHVKYIRLLFSQDKEEALNKELDKLELLNPDLYNELCIEFNLIEE